MKKVIILRGIPASGKSTWADTFLKKEKSFVRVSRDAFRHMLNGYRWDAKLENSITPMFEEAFRQALKSGYNVLVDNTNLKQRYINQYLRICEAVGDVQVEEKVFDVSKKEAIERDKARGDSDKTVGEAVIEKMFKDYCKMKPMTPVYFPKKDPVVASFEKDPDKVDAIVCDLDGTLALIHNRFSPYDASTCDVDDIVNVPVAETIVAMFKAGKKIIFLSGRDSKYGKPTVRFIENWLESIGLDMPYDLHMRAENDTRKDSVIKRELYESHVSPFYNVLFVLDDRNQVVDLWRSLGLTCFQVNYGDF